VGTAYPALAIELRHARSTDGYQTVWSYRRLSAARAKHGQSPERPVPGTRLRPRPWQSFPAPRRTAGDAELIDPDLPEATPRAARSAGAASLVRSPVVQRALWTAGRPLRHRPADPWRASAYICSPEGEPRSGQHWKSLDVRATRWPDTLPRHSGW